MARGRSLSIPRLFLLGVCILGTSSATAAEMKQFRVCADPRNLPFTNRRLEGFENKIAALIAKELGASPTYTWWGQRRGFISNTLKATLKQARCDVVMGVPKGYDPVLWTKPYYLKMGIRLTQVAPRCSMPADGRLPSEPDRIRVPF